MEAVFLAIGVLVTAWSWANGLGRKRRTAADREQLSMQAGILGVIMILVSLYYFLSGALG